VTVALRGLGREFEGFTIGHLTDLHRGLYVPASFIRRAVEAMNAAQPDLVVLTGDYLSRSKQFLASSTQEVARLKAPSGKLAVLGNHDHWIDADEVARQFTETAGCQVLRNESLTLMLGEGVLTFVGLDDPYTHHDDFDQAMATIPGESPTILLSHTPDTIEEASRRGVSLVLAGHTHGGQIVVPGFGPPVPNSTFGRRFVSGLHHHGSTAIYTNRGVGMAVLPVRLFCPPEVALITLKSA